MSTNEEKKGTRAVFAILILTLIGIAAVFFHANFNSTRSTCIGIAYLLMYAFIAYYGFWGYKKPHGNTLRWLVLAYAFVLLINCQSFLVIIKAITDGVSEEVSYDGLAILKKSISEILVFVSAILVGHMAGRLHRIKTNIVIMVIVLACLIARLINANYLFTQYTSNILLWITICTTYILRYRLHKDAGLADAPKK